MKSRDLESRDEPFRVALEFVEVVGDLFRPLLILVETLVEL